jgi:hypothetical protein
MEPIKNQQRPEGMTPGRLEDIIASHEVPGANSRGDRFDIKIRCWYLGETHGYRFGVGSYVQGSGPLRYRLRAGETVFTNETAAREEANRQWVAHRDEFAKVNER